MKNSILYYIDTPIYHLSIKKLIFDKDTRYGLEITAPSHVGKLLFKSYDACCKYLVEIQSLLEKLYLCNDEMPF